MKDELIRNDRPKKKWAYILIPEPKIREMVKRVPHAEKIVSALFTIGNLHMCAYFYFFFICRKL